MKPLRIGIAGYGWVAGAHITSFQEIDGCEVTAVFSRRQISDEQFRKEHGRTFKLYNDYDALLADPEIDVVSICTPHPYHVGQVEKACAAGKHVVIEKPIALDWDGCRRIRKAVAEAGVKAQVCFEVRAIGSFVTYKQMLAQGVIGPLHYAEVDYYHGIGPWYQQYAWNIKKEMGGSSLLTAGCHAMDGLIWLVGDEPVEVSSYATKSAKDAFQAYEYPTTSVTIVKFKNGAVGKVASVVDCIQPYLFNVHLVGADGSIWNDKFHTDKFGALRKTGWSTLDVQLVDSGDVAHHPYVPLFADFAAAIREDREPRHSLESAILSHKAVLAADLSAERGTPVQLAELTEEPLPGGAGTNIEAVIGDR
ncbi:MAG: Gfo/Idh/MocA family protein [Armatimonadota bacterium]